MSPVTHFFAGWVLASVSPSPLTRREKALVVVAAIAPDLDGLGIIPELLTRNSSHPLLWFSQYHHSLHTLAFALLVSIGAFLLVSSFRFSLDPKVHRRPSSAHVWLTVGLVFLSFHLHLLCDLLGARGPDGYQWPIPYLEPFSGAFQWTWHGQWALNAWPNFLITAILLAATFWIAVRSGHSPLELFAAKADRAVISSLRKRFPTGQHLP